MRIYKLIFLLAFPILGCAQAKTFSKEEIIQDLKYLKSELIAKHPNLEIYTDQSQLHNFIENIELKDSIPELEAYALMASTNQFIKDGHTLFYPNEQFLKNNTQHGKYFPIQAFWDGEKLFTIKDYSHSGKLKLGAEIISIEEINAKELIKNMLQKMMRDGNNTTYPIWVLNSYFFEYYSFFYGCKSEYKIETLHEGIKDSLELKGIPRTEIFLQIKNSRKNDKGIYVEFIPNQNTAILTIKDWHNNNLKKYYKQNFKKELKEIIGQINEKNISNLIIDVRNNQGGEPKNSKYLLSYLLDNPFVLVEHYKKKKMEKI